MTWPSTLDNVLHVTVYTPWVSVGSGTRSSRGSPGTGPLLPLSTSLPAAFSTFGIFAINSITGLSPGPTHWLNPAGEYSKAHLEPASVMPWHLMYLAGLILLLGLIALARRPRASGLQIYGTVAVALTAVGGVMQVLAASP